MNVKVANNDRPKAKYKVLADRLSETELTDLKMKMTKKKKYHKAVAHISWKFINQEVDKKDINWKKIS